MKEVLISKQFVVDARDWVNGLIIAILSSILVVIEQFADGANVIDWDGVKRAAIAGALAYIIKNFISKPRVITTYQNNDKAETIASEIKP